MADIQNCVAVIDDLEKVCLDIVGVVKAGAGWFTVLSAVFKIAKDAQDIVARAPGLLPEVKDIDPAEAGVLTQKAYNLVLNVLKAVA